MFLHIIKKGVDIDLSLIFYLEILYLTWFSNVWKLLIDEYS